MDSKQFDRLTQWMGAGNRRQVLGSAFGGAAALLGVASLPEVAAKRRVQGEGPCGNGGIKDNRCKRNGQCCTGVCDKKKGKKPYGRCRCRKLNQSCQEDRNCCATAGQPMTCVANVCVSSDSPTCPELGETCTTAAGTECCPDSDPNVVCAGGQNPARTCQDCTQPPTAAGAFCQATPGNQCCNGSPGCFVGVRIEDSQPACYSSGICRTPVDGPCTSDLDCGAGSECAQGSANCGCTGGPPTFCGVPCVSS